MAALSYPYQI